MCRYIDSGLIRRGKRDHAAAQEAELFSVMSGGVNTGHAAVSGPQ